MRIEELVLEGFKSYPVRTPITGWDASFNAITGLNGSGKSNILDAICFVLGITNMSSMRAQNQQDLIYKRGQAGITKASVTIVFDNSDKQNSPVGLEDHAQITVTRQILLPNVTKYLLNGHKTQQNTIHGIFQSVQLNINNPNFLIMQGRITKVLNMRPQEILGMVEEAAGTRMFEERKDKARKTMAKKEKRVEEINTLLKEEITPKLDTLRAEKRAYLQYQKAVSELERLARILRAWEWSEAQKRVQEKQAAIEQKEKETEKVRKDMERSLKESQAAEKTAERVRGQRDNELKKGGKFKKMEEEVAELDKIIVKLHTQVEIKNGTIADEESKVSGLAAEVQELEKSWAAKKQQVEKLTAAYTTVKDKHTETQTRLANSEDLLQTLLTGLAGSNHNTGGGYLGQLADAKARLAHATAEEQQLRTKLSMSEKELKTLEARWKSVEKEAGDDARKLGIIKAEVEKRKRAIASSGWNAELEHQRETALKEGRNAVSRLTQDRDTVKQRLSQLDFNYSLPSPNFDTRKVKGLVASLISLKSEDYGKSTALEIAAGGKLYNVVVEDERVGGELLKNGKLKKRVTLIPLNKIRAFTLTAAKLQSATHLAPGKVYPAISLVGYPDEVKAAMEFVFSDTIICDDAESAKAVTFSREVGVRSVTLQGDVYDPSGMLSGGSAPSGSGLLVRAQEVQAAEQRLREAHSRYEALEAEDRQSKSKREQWRALSQELEIKEHEMRLLEDQLGGSNATRIGAQVEEMKKTIAELQTSAQSAKDKQKTAQDEIKKLEKDMAEFKDNKEGKTEELKADIVKQKAALQKQAVVVKTQHKDLQTATAEMEQFESDIEKASGTLSDARAGVDKLRKELKNLANDVTSTENAHAKANEKLQEERATLTRFDDELKDLDAVIKEKKAQAGDAELMLKKLDHEVQNLAKDKASAATFVSNLEKQHEWIVGESHLFGTAGSHYHFDQMDIAQLRDRARELEGQQRGMKKKVNMKVINMIDSVEKREKDLKKMLSTVLKDKQKIEETIEELDRYKRDALTKTWQKVNEDFGSIFAELLPGNFAKLQPPEDKDLMDGLEVKVQLGSVWKQSLTELSGGQRSLIALSLILALLQFKPAPVYILDEIDAALDLSHTQHIGQLFRTRFRGAQFIVVSLKEGLFTNANVLFRTRFRDGTSVVERTGQRSTSALYAPAQEQEQAADGVPRRGRRGV
ncbi:condensin complex subunit SMC2 [Auriscalpium vulgare]|uniref:Condensin complex subunit SMC2 n=1 Tax=Auriscalpium vulgare TaxID=40419 RepID=A0ACB8SAE1_9AGAM|nr:condensin complex subunit SMC2 [Auriscalpium vulgare]